MSKVTRIYPDNGKEAFRQTCFAKLSKIDDREEEIDKSLAQVHALLDKVTKPAVTMINKDLREKKFSSIELVDIHTKLTTSQTKLIDAQAKLQKLRVDLHEIVAGTYDEDSDAVESLKETADQKKVRKFSEKMLAALTRVEAQ